MKIAIIGGGFSGISLCGQLIKNGKLPEEIYLIEKSNPIGKGVAYSTPFDWHLLNVRTIKMGALEDDPVGFYHWLVENEHDWRKEEGFKNLVITKDSFLPRKLYGLYLDALVKDLQIEAASKNLTFEILSDEALNLENTSDNSLRVILKDGKILDVDKVVLATGVNPFKTLPLEICSKNYVKNIWELNDEVLSEQIKNTDTNSLVIIIGTGLTMIDMVTSLIEKKYAGKILALSTHGVLPEIHSKDNLHPEGNVEKIISAKTLIAKLRFFKKEFFRQKKKGFDWRQFIDAIRLHISEIWQQSKLQDQKQFIRHLLFRWNKHRHRIPEESFFFISNLIKAGRLELVKGKILQIVDKDNLEVQFKENGKLRTVYANFVYNCSGPEYRLEKHSETLIQNLLKKEWIRPDDLGLGIKVNTSYQAEGPMRDKIYVIGSLLFGSRFETTASTELRLQASEIAKILKGE